MFKGKKLLILGANPETANIVKVAQEMGVTTIVTDYDPQAPAKKVSDISYNIDAMDVDALYEMAVNEKVDGVLVGVADPFARIQYGRWLPSHYRHQRSHPGCRQEFHFRQPGSTIRRIGQEGSAY